MTVEKETLLHEDKHSILNEQRWLTVQHHLMTGIERTIIFDYDVKNDLLAFCINETNTGSKETLIHNYLKGAKGKNIHPEDLDLYLDSFKRALHTKVADCVDFRANLFGQHYRWCRASFVSLLDNDERVHRIVGRVEDVEKEKELHHKVDRDSLTGLLNQNATKAVIGSCLEKKQSGALFVVDIDDFKEINDKLGHLFGDSFLQEVSNCLRRVFRGQDVLGRIGGDEFVVFIPDALNESTIEKKAGDILEAFKTIEIPEIEAVHASVGVSVADASCNDYASLFKKADQALYRAKNKGKNCYVLYHHSTNTTATPLPIAPRKTQAIIDEAAWPHTLAGDVFSILFHADQTEEGINEALAHVGSWLDVSRVYIFEKREGLLSNTFEWCNKDIASEIDNLQNIPDGDEHGEQLYVENFDIDGIFYLRYTEDAPAWQREILEPQGIKSMLQYGIMEKGELFGFVGFDECNANVFWTKEQINVLTRIAQMISVFLKQLRYLEKAS